MSEPRQFTGSKRWGNRLATAIVVGILLGIIAVAVLSGVSEKPVDTTVSSIASSDTAATVEQFLESARKAISLAKQISSEGDRLVRQQRRAEAEVQRQLAIDAYQRAEAASR